MTAYELLDAIYEREQYEASRGYEDWLCENTSMYGGRSIWQVHDERKQFPSAECEVYCRIQYYFDEIRVEKQWDNLAYLNALYEAYSVYDDKFSTEFVNCYFDGRTPAEVVEMWDMQEESEREDEARQLFIDQWARPMLVNDCGLSECEAEEFLFDLGY